MISLFERPPSVPAGGSFRGQMWLRARRRDSEQRVYKDGVAGATAIAEWKSRDLDMSHKRSQRGRLVISAVMSDLAAPL